MKDKVKYICKKISNYGIDTYLSKYNEPRVDRASLWDIKSKAGAFDILIDLLQTDSFIDNLVLELEEKCEIH